MRPLFDGNLLPFFQDASGNQHDFVQNQREAMPRLFARGPVAWIRFDGRDDFLACTAPGWQLKELTVFLVGAPQTNSGMFRCFLAAAKTGQNDYLSGINIDLGPGPGVSFGNVNVEGAGAGGMVNLLRDRSRFGAYRVLTLISEPGNDGVKLFADGKPQSTRDRAPSTLHADQMLLGARLYSNEADPPYASGFFGGDIAEVLVYGRALPEAERVRVEEYLTNKYASLLAPGTGTNNLFDPLAPVLNPPAVQVFLPGFETRELPVALPNINGVKYRPDGKLVALGYGGNIYLLSDSDGDGVEDKVELFWATNSLRAPIGMALTPPGYPQGQGVFVAAKGKVSLIVDTDGDDRADKEMIIAQGWKELSHGVDALGVAVDAEGAVYFGLGVADFTNAYLVERATGRSQFDLKSERGTILRVSSDLKSREIVCTGIRFPVALAFNSRGDLFCTDQEGATWLPNGNPLDELLHIRPGRHYGFPPRHPKYLPDVVDEPSTFDYGPQHQSLCGLNFNPVATAGRVFGPHRWAGDALIVGYSRGKIYRTRLVQTAAGYVADSQLIAALNMLTVDACVSPRGDLTVAAHSGQPDWGSGPNGAGKLFQIRYATPEVPQPVVVWPASPTETHVGFDRPLSPAQARALIREAAVAGGKSIVAGERFESLRPGYQVVQDQLAAERYVLPVLSTQLSADRQTLVIQTPPRTRALNYTVTLSSFEAPSASQVITQHQKIDLSHPLNGVEATWASGNEKRTIWLPHLDLEVARELTAGSAGHESFLGAIQATGSLLLRSRIDLWQMLRPAVQPGAKIDFELPPEQVTVTFASSGDFRLSVEGQAQQAMRDSHGTFSSAIQRTVGPHPWIPVELELRSGPAPPHLTVSWHTAEDPRPRPLPLHRMLLPWVVPDSAADADARTPLPPELAEASWLRGRRIFFSPAAACSTCHRLGGQGQLVGPDLSNLVHRDYDSVRTDIIAPNATLNPDHLNFHVELRNGEMLSGVLRRESPEAVTLAQPSGATVRIPREQIHAMTASSISLMPEGLQAALGDHAIKDLMKFLLTSPLEPASLKSDAPVIRTRDELQSVAQLTAGTADSPRPLRILLVAGPKDHGPDEHDYPLWQERWATLLGLADDVAVSTAFGWPSAAALDAADVAVFYSNNPGWSAAKASQLASFQAKGGGLVYVHFAIDGHDAVRELSDRIGLAWRSGASKFRHGPLPLSLDSSHPITRGFSKIQLYDESYWELEGDPRSISILATAEEDGQSRPLIWTRENGPGRVFVSVPGHYTWTFDDPVFRLILLRGICWAAREPVDRLSELATIGARLHCLDTDSND